MCDPYDFVGITPTDPDMSFKKGPKVKMHLLFKMENVNSHVSSPKGLVVDY